MRLYLRIFMMAFALSFYTCGFGDDATSSSQSDNKNSDSDKSEDQKPEVAFDRVAFIKNYADNIVVPAYAGFKVESAALLTAATASLDALKSDAADKADKKLALEEAWKKAMNSWQGIELLQVGPAGAMNKIMGGEDIRDEVYSWPTTSSCKIDQVLDDSSHSKADFFEKTKVNAYGLDAAEYLIFVNDIENTCPGQVALNSSGSWKAKSVDDLSKLRAEYIVSIAAQVKKEAEKLVALWGSQDDSFYKKFVEFDSGGIYSDGQSVVNDVFAAMFYAEKKVKDFKLADPAGIGLGCSKAFCLELREARYSNYSKENMIANLIMFEKIFLGEAPGSDDGYGFYELLLGRNAKELADKMKNDTAEAIKSLKALKGSLKDLLENDLDSLKGSYEKLKRITDSFKTQFVTTLDLRVPKEGAADND